MTGQYDGVTNADLVAQVTGNAGPAGAGAAAELQRRLLDATSEVADDLVTLAAQLRSANTASARQTTRLLALTWIIVVLTVVLAVLTGAQLAR